MARAKVDPKVAKAKRQKVILIAGSVLLLGVLAIQLPKLLKQLKGSPSATPAATTTTSASPTGVPSAPGAAAAPTPSGSFANTAGAYPASVDKLVRFTRFSAKDPFVQQVKDATAAGASGSSAAPSASAPVASKPATPPTVFGTVEGQSKSKPDSEPGGAEVKGLPQATIRVNGKSSQVQLGKSFPKSNPAFRVAGFAPGSVQIVVVGGSLADGSTTLKLRRKHKLTLVNTADGSRYTLELLSMSRTAT